MTVGDLTRNAVEVLPAGGLEAKLKLGRPLRVKLGIDVTSPDVHIGRAIPLQRMRAFQDAGHTGVLIIGDYTTRIGDPSGRSAERPILSDEEIDANARTYLEQAMVVLDPDRTEVRHNGEWLAKLSFADVVRLTRTITVARLLERDDFAKRMAASLPVSVSELLYPLMQAYDSVAVEADVELGGTDQLYNLLTGREVMQHYGLEPQVVLTTPLLLSWDGEKMSSSMGNNIRRGGRSSPTVTPPRAIRWRRSSRSRAGSSSARMGRRRLPGRRRISRASSGKGARPRKFPTSLCPRATPCTCRHSLPARSASARRRRRAG
jgi:tyrosyl-tRNA synthetase